MLVIPIRRDMVKEVALLAQESGVTEWSFGKLKDNLEASHTLGFVAYSKDTLIGCILGLFDPFQSEIHFLCVRPLWQNKGVGSCLLETFEGNLREHRLASKEVMDSVEELWVHLEVRASNKPARTLYEKNGYVFTRMRESYYQATFRGSKNNNLMTQGEDAALYQKQLTL